MIDFPLEYLEECFDVDFVSGILTWKTRPRSHFETDMAFNTVNPRQSGKVAGRFGKNGYSYVGIRGLGEKKKLLLTHRVLFFMYHGEWVDVVDHFDGDIENNNISNLRPSTQGTNMRNQKRRNTNQSGVTGVRWYDRYNKWHAQGTHNSKQHHLGYFESLDDAIKARQYWESTLDFTERHGK